MVTLTDESDKRTADASDERRAAARGRGRTQTNAGAVRRSCMGTGTAVERNVRTNLRRRYAQICPAAVMIFAVVTYAVNVYMR